MKTRAFVLWAVLMGTAARIGMADGSTFRTSVQVKVDVVSTVACRILVTAYNSDPSQTDETPFVTASQTPTRWGVAAARWAPRGTRIYIPGHFGEQLFSVEDRMPPKNWCKMDVWHQEREDADAFGKRFLDVVVIGAPEGFVCPSQPPSEEFKCPEPVTVWDRRAAAPRCPSFLPFCRQDKEPVRIAMQ